MKTIQYTRSQQLQSHLSGLSFLSLEKPRETVASSVEALNTLLPEGGFATGSFIEILNYEDGFGACSLALKLARPFLSRREAWAVVDTDGTFYPPAVAASGYGLKQLILLRPRPDEDAWAFTQLLRSADISVCFWTTRRMDSMLFRRLQLAAERGGGMGFVIRPTAAKRRPCWARMRLMAARRSIRGQSRLCARVLHLAGRFVDSKREVEVAE